MSSCRACDQPDGGYVHTCSGSGTFLAAEAHLSGELEEIAEAWPRFDVLVGFVVKAVDEQMVREKLTGLVEALLTDDLVERAEFTIEERA